MNISAVCFEEEIKFNWTTRFVTCSLKKWYLIGMWLVLEWRDGILDILMALVLSHCRGIGSSYFTSKSASVWIIQIIYVQQVASTMYSSFVVDKDIEPCFLLIYATKESPKKNAPPLVLFFHPNSFPNYHLNMQLIEYFYF